MGAISLAVGTAGLIVTLLGFWLTLKQLSRTKTAADAAANAVEGVKSRISAYDAIYEISRASTALRETQRHLRNKAWESAIDSYQSVRDALVRLLALSSSLDDANRREIGAMLSDLKIISDRLDKFVQDKKVDADVSKAISSLRLHGELLLKVSIVLEKAAT